MTIWIPPPPAKSSTPHVAFYDTECYPNYWLLKFRPKGGATYSFRLYEGQAFSVDQVVLIRHLFRVYQVVSFNGNGYDVPMIGAALIGHTPEQLKVLNDRIIVEKVRPWELGLPEWRPDDHIDVMEVAPGAGSLKQYAGRIHCKMIQDLPYDPGHPLTAEQRVTLDAYCENDLAVLEALFDALAPQIEQRVVLSKRYGLDLRSKSDAQVAEAVLRKRCEQATGWRISRPEIPWNLAFNYKTPEFIRFTLPQLQRALELVRQSTFRLGPTGAVEMPPQLEGLEITIGRSTYKMGIGGLHSQEKRLVAVSGPDNQIRMPDVASYYPSLILNSGEWPQALGPTFLAEYAVIKDERLVCKALAKKLKKLGFEGTVEYVEAATGDGGGKIMINGTFGKTNSPFSVLFAPKMFIQTTVTGQLSLLMLIEWHEYYGIPVISANTDGIVIDCPRDKLELSEHLIAEWQMRTGLEMETDDYVALYARDVNNYFAIKTPDDVKRKGEYAKSGLIEKKNPDVEICSEAVAEFLAKGTPIETTIFSCRDIRKFVTVQRVSGGGVKLWGEGPRKGARVVDMIPTLEANGWVKRGRKWVKPHSPALINSVSGGTGAPVPGYEPEYSAQDAYRMCFTEQRREYLGKVVRWYYGTRSPGPIVYATNGHTVSLSYGARPCMTLPDEFPDDVDYAWYITKADNILRDVGYYRL